MVPYSFVQASLLLHMVIWVNLYHSRFHFNRHMENLFYFYGVIAIMVIQKLQIEIGYFTPFLLQQYVFFVMISTYLFNTRFEFKKAVCLGFLITFLNSFYWEMPYHILEVYMAGPYAFNADWWIMRLPQFIRLGSIPFLYTNFKITDYRLIWLGLITGSILTAIRFTYFNGFAWVIHPFHRVICLLLLSKTIIDAEVIPRTEEKKNA